MTEVVYMKIATELLIVIIVFITLFLHTGQPGKPRLAVNQQGMLGTEPQHGD